MNLNTFENNKLFHNIFDWWNSFTAVTESWESIGFYLIVVFYLSLTWHQVSHNVVQYVTFSITVTFLCHVLVKDNLFSFWLHFVKKSDVFEVTLTELCDSCPWHNEFYGWFWKHHTLLFMFNTHTWMGILLISSNGWNCFTAGGTQWWKQTQNTLK